MTKTKSTLVYTQPVSRVLLFKNVQLMLPFRLSSNVFNGKKLINSLRQAPNLERLLCKSKFMLVEEHFYG